MGPKLHSKLGRTVGIMLRIYEPLFSMGKFVAMESSFCVTNGIVSLAAKGVYAGVIIKKHWYWPKNVPGDLIDWNFAENWVEDVDTLEAATEDGKPFCIFCFKETDYTMNIMASWMALDELEGANMKRKYKGRDGES